MSAEHKEYRLIIALQEWDRIKMKKYENLSNYEYSNYNCEFKRTFERFILAKDETNAKTYRHGRCAIRRTHATRIRQMETLEIRR